MIGERLTRAVQVPPTATEAQLKTAYKKGALKFHPGMSPYILIHLLLGFFWAAD